MTKYGIKAKKIFDRGNGYLDNCKIDLGIRESSSELPYTERV
jgi:hypothetical protein